MLTCASTDKYRPLQKHIIQKLMELSLTEERMTISIDFGSSNERKITAEDVLLGAYDIIARVFSQEQVNRAYYNTNPETKTNLKHPNLELDEPGYGKHEYD